jgi:hypothetical protein
MIHAMKKREAIMVFLRGAVTKDLNHIILLIAYVPSKIPSFCGNLSDVSG